MTTRSKCRKPIATLLAAATALGITLAPKHVESYATGSTKDPSIHQFLVDKLIAFHPSAKYDITAIKRGTVNEDSPGNLAADTLHRYVHHFQHWQTGKGIYDFAPVKEWAMNGDLQKDYPFGDHSWNKVQEEYETGTIGESFGSIFHLIADLTVPAHTRSDPHPFSSSSYMEELTSGLWPADFYEVWTHENRNKIMGAVVPKNIPPVESISGVFDGLAQFTGSNFYSDTKVDGSVDCNWEGKYCMRDVEGQKVRVLRQGFLRKFPDRVCLEDAWKILGGKAVEYGAAAAGLLESSSSCTSHASKVCSNGDVYWENSCGALEDKIKDCTGTEKCENGECVGGSCNPASGGGSNSVFYDSFDNFDTVCRWDLVSGAIYVADGKMNLEGGDDIITKTGIIPAKCQNKDFTLEYTLKTTNGSGLDIFFGDELIIVNNSAYIIYQCQPYNNEKIEGLNLTSYTPIKLQKQNNTLDLYVNGIKKGSISCTDDATHIYLAGKNNATNLDFVKLSCY